MPRPRTGSLELRPNGWHARLTVDLTNADGSTRQERRWVPLGTFDKSRATRMLAKLARELAAGRLVPEARAETRKPETFDEYSDAWLAARKAAGVVMAADEGNHLTRYILPTLGPLALADVRPVQVRAVLQACVALGRSRETVRKVRGTILRVLGSAFRDELVSENAVLRVEVPSDAREDERERVILTDVEVARYLSSPEADLEVKVASVCSRVLGGMRTAEVLRWAWEMVDRGTFAVVRVPRAKARRGTVGRVQELIVPDPMRAVLRGWWAAQSCPEQGALFPVRRGERKGDFRVGRGHSFARRLRRDLLRAGVLRHACDGSCVKAAREGKATRCERFASDPLYSDTSMSRRVDFHSFRRAFASALADAGINVQTAMHLAAHSDAKTHALYVMRTDAMKQIPVSAVPNVNASLAVLARTVDDSIAADRGSSGKLARPRGFEPLTYGSGGRRSIQLSYGRKVTRHGSYPRCGLRTRGATLRAKCVGHDGQATPYNVTDWMSARAGLASRASTLQPKPPKPSAASMHVARWCPLTKTWKIESAQRSSISLS